MSTPLAPTYAVMDGNEAAARVAYRASEVIAIYPITPASPDGELADAMAARGHLNALGEVPTVVEMQSEGGAAGAVHGALQAGALTTTFTASQGLLLMLPNMYKIAGELTPAVIHVAARSVATHALSIFGDHSDVMAARQTGFAMLASGSVQEAQDMAAIAHMATLHSRLPFLHFFDGFRTSHEVNKIALLPEATLDALLDPARILEHRARALNPDAPVLRGTAQNPDVFFQAREACNPHYINGPQAVQAAMDRFFEATGRQYRLFDYEGAPDAERVIVLMGSGAGTAVAAARSLIQAGEKVGILKVRLYRPFDAGALVEALPKTVARLAVLDRTKEPGSPGEPLYLDILSALNRDPRRRSVEVVGGRYGLSSKEFTPAMVRGVFQALSQSSPPHGFTVGIVDDVTHTSLSWDKAPQAEPEGRYAAVFFGLGSDGTVGASKNTAKIIGEHTHKHAQGYFVYDSKKSGAVTVSHLRFADAPIDAAHLVEQADFVGCHRFDLLDKLNVLRLARPGATVLINSGYGPKALWGRLSDQAKRTIEEKRLEVFGIDAYKVAQEAGLGGRINTIMQTAFFALSNLLPKAQALEAIKTAVAKTYAKRGPRVIEQNTRAIDLAEAALFALERGEEARAPAPQAPALVPVPKTAPDFVQRVTAMIMKGQGDLLPVSALPVDGTFPTHTAQYEKRSIARTIPIWEPDICTQCGLCPLVCPHAAIRLKAFDEGALSDAPESFAVLPWKGKELEGEAQMRIQVAPDDCTGCGVCVDICPARSKAEVKKKAINMAPKAEHLEVERKAFDFFLSLPSTPRSKVNLNTVKGSQLIDPLFEYSGACAGCGETPYLKLLSQLFGDRAVIANATGCSSIYGGNLPTTPWAKDSEGRGPAWSNSLFEDNAEFGLGMRLAIDQQAMLAKLLLKGLAPSLGEALVDALLEGAESEPEPAALQAQRERLSQLAAKLEPIAQDPQAAQLRGVVSALLPRSVWIVGGDGWAYDIGFGGLDHALASDRNINVLVLDTEVYSNTGGQASKATPRAAVAKFAASGKPIKKKDLGMIAMAYGHVYVAQVALGASYKQTIRAFNEADAYHGPSLIIAYSTCIAHGIDMSCSISHMKEATASGYWPLYRFDPRAADQHPFSLDSAKPKSPLRSFAQKEGRFAVLMRSDPERANALLRAAQEDIHERWRYYEQLSKLDRAPEVIK